MSDIRQRSLAVTNTVSPKPISEREADILRHSHLIVLVEFQGETAEG